MSAFNPTEQLQKYWGYTEFRYPQAEVIQCLLQKQDALVVMPTGGGKSICFQLPAVLGQGLTLVVSPLIALMENQVQELQTKGLPAVCLHSELPRPKRLQILRLLEQQHYRLLYISPETLFSPKLWELFSQKAVKIQGLMIDEAHCLVQWGDSFRPVYRRLGTFRKALQQSFSIAAFTATADKATQQEICQVLHLDHPQYFVLSPYRSHLTLGVKIAWSPYCRHHLLQTFLAKYRGHSGLIYGRSRRDCEKLSQRLNQENWPNLAYHGGLDSQQRRYIEQQWLTGQIPFVVCTNAFGLGINKADLRWIVHYQPPHLLAEYLQEIGRAGRDQQPAECLALISEPTGFLDSSDRQRRQYFDHQLQQQYQRAREQAKILPKSGNILSLKSEFPELELSLALLHRLGQLEWRDPFQYRLLDSPNPQDLKTLHSPSTAKMMTAYLNTRQCRWRFLLNAFDLSEQSVNFACGKCDNCRRKRR
ncbi:MAG: RecQ family ATP-dependent DNA helicase [Microcystaceae cyanobacterium]